jgi:hypothetical protein
MGDNLICTRVQYGIMPYGPAYGQRAIEIEVGLNQDQPLIWDHENPHTVPVYSQFIQRLKDQDLEGSYTKTLDGTQSTFLVFRGGEIERLENVEEWSALYRAITQDCIELSKKILKDNPESLLKGNVKPPFMVYVGTPTVFTASRDWYQHFNVVLAEIDFRTPAYLSVVSQTALQEMLNHPNSLALAFVDDPNQLNDFYQPMKKIRKTVVIECASHDRGITPAVLERAMDGNYKYCTFYEEDWRGLPAIY